MKKIFIALTMIVALSSFTYANDNKISEKTVESEVSVNSTFDDVFGRCTIIIENSDGDVVYSITLAANTWEACQSMAQQTLTAFNNGSMQP